MPGNRGRHPPPGPCSLGAAVGLERGGFTLQKAAACKLLWQQGLWEAERGAALAEGAADREHAPICLLREAC